MKKAIPFLFVLIALSCNKDSNIPNIETPVDENLMKQNVLLSVNIDSDNYYRNDESFSTSGYISYKQKGRIN